MSEQNDLISRQDAIDAICDEWCKRKNKDCLYPYDRSKGDSAYCDGCDDVERIKKLPPAQPENKQQAVESKQQAIEGIDMNNIRDKVRELGERLDAILCMLPPAQPQRDIPKKPNETIDRAWGISTRQAVCPNCDAYLGRVHFICESDKKKVTYCESCGQAIDWTDWEVTE